MAASDSLTGAPRILGSLWTGLNPALLAKFYPLKRNNDGGWSQSTDVRQISEADSYSVDDGFEVHAPITDGTSELSANWHSPFEGAGAESQAPTISAMLQSGSLTPEVQAFFGLKGDDAKAGSSGVQSLLKQAQGRTGITKLNSTQVFNGMPPVKLSMTLHFRALLDPISEVRDPIMQLKQWALPAYLSNDSVIAGALKNGAKQSPLETIFPSVAPQIIGMRYGDLNYQPLVIESVSDPLTVPRDSDGAMIACTVQITLGTLTALDRRDIQTIYL
ncbi:hypothetical protein [Paraburkholderia ginsengisoli]|uniref:Uncharacterized protein n=1 Tax=Paraburkholderia ginsengisoli TaxID=311231 RepID=A0A7T4N1W6_9BURK|nr:hypothetical protein [Paraburkholderia ginsengisoli]QQC63747.1 hypothetical protein I6I06_15830 [Paraburkholderia ginsengisoli]